MTKGFYTFLPNRAVVSASGPDAHAFLQSMITQDLNQLGPANPLLYSLLLTAQGKLHYDFFLWYQDGAIWIEAESARAEDLLGRLRMFTLRKNVTLDLIPVQVAVAWGTDETPNGFIADPRNPKLGYRSLGAPTGDLQAADFENYDRLRIDLTIPDGSRDIAWENDTVADLGLENLNAVSFSKGCYLGQELTSRMHHRGLSKRGLYTVDIPGEAQRAFTDLLAGGNLIGDMRSSQGRRGLAILRHDSLDLAPKAGLIPVTL
ncbi:MAG TPA: folate-binding protein [Alphaproteobacteria bacterium]